VWYFICPRTGRKCRKLYLVDTYFYHRSAFKSCMYEKQTQSKKYRQLDRILGQYFLADGLFEQLSKKYLKKTYAGKPTKRYLRIMQKVQESERIPIEELIKLLLH
jgi:hypothetical protein